MNTSPVRYLVVICILTGFSSAPAKADSFGTLFTTNEQRAQLDNARLPASAYNNRSGGNELTGAEAPAAIRLDGTLVSNLGRKEVWINGIPESSGTTPGITISRVGNDGLVEIQLEQAAATPALKPGQRYLPATGKVREIYQRETAGTDD